MVVDQSNLSVDRGCQLGDSKAQGEQRILYHLSIVFELALGLPIGDVKGIIFIDLIQRSHHIFFIEGQLDDVFKQCPQRIHVLFH